MGLGTNGTAKMQWYLIVEYGYSIVVLFSTSSTALGIWQSTTSSSQTRIVA